MLLEGWPCRCRAIEVCGATDDLDASLSDSSCGDDGGEVKFLSPDTGRSHSESTMRVGRAFWHFLVILCHSPRWTRSSGNF